MTKFHWIAYLFALGACTDGIAVQQYTAALTGPGCTHGACATGTALSGSCDACASSVCQHDAYCCDIAWDALCVAEADQFCAGVCQASCSVGPVPIIKLSDWNGQLPAPLGREVLVLGPWTDTTQMSASVYQEQPDQVVLTVVFDGRDLARFFTVATTPSDIIIVGSAPGIGPNPNPGPGNPIGTPTEILAAAQALARSMLEIGVLSCSPELFQGPTPEPAIP
jgi:hypothetical protein